MEFTQNVDLDAQMVLASMNVGIDGLIQLAFNLRHVFAKPDDALERANWLKTQSKSYIKQVSDRAAELEKQK